jgi:ABC-type Mn2+/Zn2+ transport system permease subunit
VAGLLISYYLGPSTGATISLLLSGYFAVTFCFRKKRQ